MPTVSGVILFGSYLTDFLFGDDNNYAGFQIKIQIKLNSK